jgi:cell wall-associated NlpC family hydrolase
MSLKNTLFSKLAPSLLALYFAAAISAQAADTVVEPTPELVVPKESMFQAGKSYISRVSDRLVDTVTGKSDELINRAMEVIGVRYRWDRWQQLCWLCL